jgi:hypothetical protein
MTMSGHTGFLAASDAVRFIMFGVLMTLLLGSVAWASFIDERKASKPRLRELANRDVECCSTAESDESSAKSSYFHAISATADRGELRASAQIRARSTFVRW